MNELLQALQNTTYTHNGAITNKSTQSAVLDYFYHAPARRGQDTTDLFAAAFQEDALLAIKAVFYVRDIRGGQGERDTFRVALSWLATHKPTIFARLVPHIPTYGRWDDMTSFADNDAVVACVKAQLTVDLESERTSLLAKWMPSENTSSKKTKELAGIWMKALGLTPRQYRTMLVTLRRKLQIVEQQMSAGQWNEIEYQRVPSRAAMIYRKAFKQHDAERYEQYLVAVQAGEKKINAGTLYPYDIVNKYLYKGKTDNATLEALWNALPNYADTDANALVVADVSGSMDGMPLCVAISLAMYIAERNSGPWRNHFMTFSAHPELVAIEGNTLAEKINNINCANWDMNTNLQAAFNLILSTAQRHHVSPEDMPQSVFIISDMEFDTATGGNSKTNFEAIQQQYAAAGYSMPKLVFWNVNSTNEQTPVTQNENGVYLVAGCSPSIFKNAINTKATTPYEMMLDVLNSERYTQLDAVFK